MNVERMLILADDLEAPQPLLDGFQFDFGTGLMKCGARGCIAGRTVMLFEPESFEVAPLAEGSETLIEWRWVRGHAKRLLDLTECQTSELFIMWPDYIGMLALEKGDRVAAATLIRDMVGVYKGEA